MSRLGGDSCRRAGAHRGCSRRHPACLGESWRSDEFTLHNATSKTTTAPAYHDTSRRLVCNVCPSRSRTGVSISRAVIRGDATLTRIDSRTALSMCVPQGQGERCPDAAILTDNQAATFPYLKLKADF
ncbi:hypothetical protein CABS01_12923 [Colletotrichum abscissum]|uniref:uncharacterized protein n=1 Tax=Colletotrichum abscissum TaxID=1671311 RepID=UPI0027D51C2D|nr:uncharacterized protein CABS01_12923 [Colletotrichum abscissum]KAK1487444.1 hypothetical protein CABS01_12923 [Colletotrichum abscissum]